MERLAAPVRALLRGGVALRWRCSAVALPGRRRVQALCSILWASPHTRVKVSVPQCVAARSAQTLLNTPNSIYVHIKK